MKYITLLLLITGLYPLQAQESLKPRFSIGFNVAPTLNYRVLQVNTTDPNDRQFAEAMLETRNENERFKPGYTAGITLMGIFRDRFIAEAGVQYSNMGYQTKWIDVFVTSQNNPDPDPNTTLGRARNKYNYYYTDLLAKAGTSFGNKHIRIVFCGGVIVSYMQKASRTFIYYNNTTARETNILRHSLNQVSATIVSAILMYSRCSV